MYQKSESKQRKTSFSHTDYIDLREKKCHLKSRCLLIQHSPARMTERRFGGPSEGGNIFKFYGPLERVGLQFLLASLLSSYLFHHTEFVSLRPRGRIWLVRTHLAVAWELPAAVRVNLHERPASKQGRRKPRQDSLVKPAARGATAQGDLFTWHVGTGVLVLLYLPRGVLLFSNLYTTLYTLPMVLPLQCFSVLFCFVFQLSEFAKFEKSGISGKNLYF